MVGVASAPPCRWDLEVRAAITLAYGNATAVRDCVSLPPVGPHCLLLSHRAANAAHRGLEQLERVLVDRSASSWAIARKRSPWEVTRSSQCVGLFFSSTPASAAAPGREAARRTWDDLATTHVMKSIKGLGLCVVVVLI